MQKQHKFRITAFFSLDIDKIENKSSNLRSLLFEILSHPPSNIFFFFKGVRFKIFNDQTKGDL